MNKKRYIIYELEQMWLDQDITNIRELDGVPITS